MDEAACRFPARLLFFTAVYRSGGKRIHADVIFWTNTYFLHILYSGDFAVHILDRIFRHPKLITIIAFGITAFFAAQLLNLKIDNDIMNFIPSDYPAIQSYAQLDETYGGQFITSVGLKTPYGTISDPEFLDTVRTVTDAITDMPYVMAVTSLTNTPDMSGADGGIQVEMLVPDGYTGTAAEREQLRERLYGWEMYDQLYSKDFRSTQIVITLDMHLNTGGEETEDLNNTEVAQTVYSELGRILAPVKEKGYEVYVAGYPVLMGLTTENIRRDLIFLLPLVIVVLIVTLLLSFHRRSGIILPLLTVGVSVVWTMGLMCLLRIPINILATIIPVILVAVGSAYAIHVINKYYDACACTDVHSREAHRQLVIDAVRSIKAPVILAGLTTMAGFASLAFTDIIPVRYFGIFSSFGVFAALVTAVFLLPSLLILRGPSRMGESRRSSFSDRELTGGFSFFALRPRLTVFLSVVLFCISLAGLSRVTVENALVGYYKDSTDVVQAEKFLGREFGGTSTFSISIEGTEPGDLADPRILTVIDELETYLKEEYPEVTGITGFTQFIKRINQIINWNTPPAGTDISTDELAARYTEAFAYRPTTPSDAKDSLGLLQQSVNYQGTDYYEIPADPEKYGVTSDEKLKSLITGYLMLMSAGTEGWIDDPMLLTKGRVLVQMESGGSRLVANITDSITAFADARFPDGYTLMIAGPVVTEQAVTSAIVRSQIVSIILSSLMVIIILVVYFKSLVYGLISVVPILFSILINFGLMGFFGINLDITTSMVASIAIGIGIDYVIHFLDAYRKSFASVRNHRQAVQETLQGTGKAIVFNAISVLFGFSVLAFSSFNPLMYLGILIAVTMLTSATGALTVLPVLLGFINRKKEIQ